MIALKFDDDCVYFIFETATLVRTEADQKRQNKQSKIRLSQMKSYEVARLKTAEPKLRRKFKRL